MPPGPGGFGEARDVACQYLLSHRYALGAALALLADAVEHSPDVRSLESGQFGLAEMGDQIQPYRDLAPDVGRRLRAAAAPGTKLVGDITYLPTWQGFAYLATVIDCCTKECIRYAITDHMRAALLVDALRMAARNYALEPGAILHTDRGSQYLSQAFAETTTQLGIRHSVGRVGSCFDNSQAESFNATLKVERPVQSSSAIIPNGSTRRWAIEPHAMRTATI
jgi:transposase InsO family protein